MKQASRGVHGLDQAARSACPAILVKRARNGVSELNECESSERNDNYGTHISTATTRRRGKPLKYR